MSFALSKFFSDLTLPRGLSSRGQIAFERCQFSGEILRILRLHAVLQSLIKDERIAQIENCILKCRTLDRLQFVRLFALIVDLFQER